MTKDDFLSRLEKGLASVSPEDRDAALEYYREYFDDAGKNHEEDVIAELGSPEKLASDIRGETSPSGALETNYTFNNQQMHTSPQYGRTNTHDLPGGYVPPRGGQSPYNKYQDRAYSGPPEENAAIRVLKIFLLVIAAPVVFALAIAGAVILLIPFIIAVAFGFGSTALVLCALPLFSVSLGNAIFMLGLAFILISITIACVFGGFKLFTSGARPLVSKCADIYYRYFASSGRTQQ